MSNSLLRRLLFANLSLICLLSSPISTIAGGRGSLLNQPNGSPAPQPSPRLDLLNQVRQKPKPPARPMCQGMSCSPVQITAPPQSSFSLPEQRGQKVDTRGQWIPSMIRSVSAPGQGQGQSTSQMMQSYEGNKSYYSPNAHYEAGGYVTDYRGTDVNFGGGNPHRSDVLPGANLDTSHLSRW